MICAAQVLDDVHQLYLHFGWFREYWETLGTIRDSHGCQWGKKRWKAWLGISKKSGLRLVSRWPGQVDGPSGLWGILTSG